MPLTAASSAALRTSPSASAATNCLPRHVSRPVLLLKRRRFAPQGGTNGVSPWTVLAVAPSCRCGAEAAPLCTAQRTNEARRCCGTVLAVVPLFGGRRASSYRCVNGCDMSRWRLCRWRTCRVVQAPSSPTRWRSRAIRATRTWGMSMGRVPDNKGTAAPRSATVQGGGRRCRPILRCRRVMAPEGSPR